MASVRAEHFFLPARQQFFPSRQRVLLQQRSWASYWAAGIPSWGPLAAPRSRLKPALSMGLMTARFGGAIRAGRAVSSARNR
jgi:hypothetical protein